VRPWTDLSINRIRKLAFSASNQLEMRQSGVQEVRTPETSLIIRRASCVAGLALLQGARNRAIGTGSIRPVVAPFAPRVLHGTDTFVRFEHLAYLV
jgi:hypothetical protein